MRAAGLNPSLISSNLIYCPHHETNPKHGFPFLGSLTKLTRLYISTLSILFMPLSVFK